MSGPVKAEGAGVGAVTRTRQHIVVGEQQDVGRFAGRMTARVGERFLQNSVDDVRLGAAHLRVQGTCEPHAAGCACCLDSVRDVGELWLW
jgi:hypothetical protein